MSRIGSKPLPVDKDVNIALEGSLISVTGPKGKLAVTIPAGVKVSQSDGNIIVTTSKSNLQGLTRSLLSNALTGVKVGWKKELELVGVGFRAQSSGRELTLSLGFSHPVVVPAPEGITFEVSENKITISGADKYVVGQLAATIRDIKPPEPYKGKGIRYKGEKIRKKLGKAAKVAGAVGPK